MAHTLPAWVFSPLVSAGAAVSVGCAGCAYLLTQDAYRPQTLTAGCLLLDIRSLTGDCGHLVGPLWGGKALNGLQVQQ